MPICLGRHIACARTNGRIGKELWNSRHHRRRCVMNGHQQTNGEPLKTNSEIYLLFIGIRVCSAGSLCVRMAMYDTFMHSSTSSTIGKWNWWRKKNEKNEEIKLLKIVCEWVHAGYSSSNGILWKSVGEPKHRRQRRWWSLNRYARNLWFWFCMCAVHHHRCK